MALYEPKSLRRREDLRLLTGRGTYTADAHPPGLLHAVLVRSPHAHADIRSIDLSAARATPGVVAAVTGEDLTTDGIAPIPGGIGFPRPDGSAAPKTDRAILARGRVRFVGEPVAAVIAETYAAAQEAAEAVLVDYAERRRDRHPRRCAGGGRPAALGHRARQCRVSLARRPGRSDRGGAACLGPRDEA